jgi:hypothetical protein
LKSTTASNGGETTKGRPRRRAEPALRLLAGSPVGCTEATVETLDRLVLDGFATATPGTVHAGGRPIKVTWLTITDLGRQALTGYGE